MNNLPSAAEYASRLLLTFGSALLLSSCGGGGGGGNNGGNQQPPSPPANQAPTADAGTNTNADEGSTVTIDGSGTDPDGTISTYHWAQISGPIVTISDDSLATVSFIAPQVSGSQTVVLQLTVTDDDGAQDSDTVEVSINDLSAALPAAQVMTAQGIIEGTLENGLKIYKGVSYAAPPVGDLRFLPPKEVPFVAGVTETKALRDFCIQPLGGVVQGSEDCLYLNIWAPDDGLSHPVIVFLHGGSRLSPLLDGSNLARESKSVVVTLHRREFVMAYLAIQELADESPSMTSGNYGVLDIIAALEWVQNNIVEFGGDPLKVMLAGESSGGGRVCNIFGAPSAAGLFQSAAVQSGVCGLTSNYKMTASVDELSLFPPLRDLQSNFLSTSGCDAAADPLQCIRLLPAEDVVAAAVNSGGTFVPAIDDVVIVDNPQNALVNQIAGNFSLIAGSTEEEASNFSNPGIVDDDSYLNYLNDTFSAEDAAELYDLYPTMNYASALLAWQALQSDLVGCIAQRLADAASASRPTYLFLLKRGRDLSDIAGHADDVVYLFNSFAQIGVTPDAIATDITSAMQSGWSQLAAQPSVDPLLDAGMSGNPVWLATAEQSVFSLELGNTVEVVNDYRGGRCPILYSVFDN